MSNWLELCSTAGFNPCSGRAFEVNGTAIAVFNINGEFLAVENLCTHDGSPLVLDGLDPVDQIDGDRITCPHHGAVFCLRSGQALSPPAYENVQVYVTRILDGMLQVRFEQAIS